jgi:hypothetical protein
MTITDAAELLAMDAAARRLSPLTLGFYRTRTKVITKIVGDKRIDLIIAAAAQRPSTLSSVGRPRGNAIHHFMAYTTADCSPFTPITVRFKLTSRTGAPPQVDGMLGMADVAVGPSGTATSHCRVAGFV